MANIIGVNIGATFTGTWTTTSLNALVTGDVPKLAS